MKQRDKIKIYTLTHLYLFKRKIEKLINVWNEYIKFCRHANKIVKAALKKEFEK